MSLRKVAGLLMAFGLAVGLIGAGVGASFTDSATAVANINVGTFGISIDSTTPNAVVSNANHTVTCPTVSIMSSAAATAPCEFTVTSTGTINPTITITATTPASLGTNAVTSLLAIPTPFVLTTPQSFNGGLSWGVLDNTALGQSSSITYTISASA